jgi:hypothetical protein
MKMRVAAGDEHIVYAAGDEHIVYAAGEKHIVYVVCLNLTSPLSQHEEEGCCRG